MGKRAYTWTYKGHLTRKGYLFSGGVTLAGGEGEFTVSFATKDFYPVCSQHAASPGICSHIADLIETRHDAPAFAEFLETIPNDGGRIKFLLNSGYAFITVEATEEQVVRSKRTTLYGITNLGSFGAYLAPGDSLLTVREILQAVNTGIPVCPSPLHGTSAITFFDKLFIANNGMCSKCFDRGSGDDLIPDVDFGGSRVVRRSPIVDVSSARGVTRTLPVEIEPILGGGFRVTKISEPNSKYDSERSHSDTIQYEHKREELPTERVRLKDGPSMEEMYGRILREARIGYRETSF